MKKIITYGTFDLLHYGHIRLLNRARALGDWLVVGLSTDEFNAAKGKNSYFCYDERRHMLESLRDVDLVVPESNWEQKIEDVRRLEIDCFVIGDDWKGHFDFLKPHCEVVYLSRTEEISTTKIKRDLAQAKLKEAVA
jgi:glycerol-3-phosphate cytidylyltransferase